jgi:hypothetical protein
MKRAENMAINNKESAPLKYYAKIYAQLDPHEISSRCNIPYDEKTCRFSLRLMGENLFVRHPDFAIYYGDETQMENNPISILLIRYLIEGKIVLATDYNLTYRDIPNGQAYYTNFLGRCIKRLAGTCGSKLKHFSKVMDDIGAKRINMGDCAYRFEFLNNLFMTFILWEGDDEFPPSAQILFDNNFPLAFSAEDVAVVGDISIDYLSKRIKQLNDQL